MLTQKEGVYLRLSTEPWIEAHSNRKGIAFSEYSELSISEVGKINRISPYMNKDSTIVICGCNAAGGGKEAYNIANIIHKYTGATVYGPPTLAGRCLPEMQENGKVIGVIYSDGKKMIKF